MDREGHWLSEVLERLAGRPCYSPLYSSLKLRSTADRKTWSTSSPDLKKVTEANEWGHGAALLHLKDALKETAEDCG